MWTLLTGAGISGGLCNCIPQYSVGCGCLSVLGMPAFGSKVLMYHVYISLIFIHVLVLLCESVLHKKE